jgi:hypothetical protein
MAQLKAGSTVGGSGIVTKTGDNTISGVLKVEKNVGTGPTYATGQLELRNSDAGDVSMGFRRVGKTACQLRHESNGLILSGTSPTTAADFYAYGNVTAYSDERYKTDILPIISALAKVNQIGGYTFKRTNAEEGEEDRRHAGVIAQEVQKVLPEVISTDSDGMLSVAYGNIVGLLIEAIKELTVKVEALEET